MADIYVSTLAFARYSPEEIIRIAGEHQLPIEFTSSFPFRDDIVDLYLNAPVKRMAHNYFPTPRVPFVLNLGSADETIRTKSIKHCLNGLELCKKVNAPFYAAHAGFCVDPDPKELGRKIEARKEIDRDATMNYFLQSLDVILKRAEALEIKFLFENNVLIADNILNGVNPLLCCDAAEIGLVLDRVGSKYLGLLFDTAHLKVSCQTLGLNADEEVEKLGNRISAIHHSDNDGKKDNNKPFEKDYWFLKHLRNHGHLDQVIEVKDISLEKVREEIRLLKEYGS